MKIVVQKFGGTSLATKAARAACVARVEAALASGMTPVIVASAMGRQGEPYATDSLIGLIGKELQTRDQDLVLACGELISAGVLAATLRERLERVTVLTGWQAGIITDGNHGDARILDVRVDRLARLLASGHTVVVAGFQGMSEQGEITTLGRGGSDTTAVALGIALEAELVEIYTDVCGVLAADPKLVPEASIIPCLTFLEVLELAKAGAKVLHPRAVNLAMEHGTNLLVRNAESEQPGTMVRKGDGYEQHRLLPVGLACQSELAQISLDSVKDTGSASLWPLKLLGDAGIEPLSVDSSSRQLRLTLRVSQLPLAEDLLREGGQQFISRPQCAQLTIVGVTPCQRAKALLALARALDAQQIPLLGTNGGGQSISALVDQSYLPTAAKAIYQTLGLGDASRDHSAAPSG